MYWKFVCEYNVEKKCFKKHGSAKKKTPFHASLFGNGLNEIILI